MNVCKYEIYNRKKEKIVLVVENEDLLHGFCIIGHGLGGYKYQPIIRMLAESFWEGDYTTLRFDATNSFGESGGLYENATATSYYEDLVDVVTWAKTQKWYQEPFILTGYSLGGLCALFYAENHTSEVKGIAAISTGISGKLFLETIPAESIQEFEKTGWVISESDTIPGFYKKLRWREFSEDLQKYDLLEKAHLLTMPVILVVGEADLGTPPAHHQILAERILGPKELHIIPSVSHTIKNKRELSEVKNILIKWIRRL